MIKWLKQALDKGLYCGQAGCLNCNTLQSFFIEKGINVDNYVAGKDVICKKCGCHELMRSRNEYNMVMNNVMNGNMPENMEQPMTKAGKHLNQYG